MNRNRRAVAATTAVPLRMHRSRKAVAAATAVQGAFGTAIFLPEARRRREKIDSFTPSRPFRPILALTSSCATAGAPCRGASPDAHIVSWTRMNDLRPLRSRTANATLTEPCLRDHRDPWQEACGRKGLGGEWRSQAEQRSRVVTHIEVAWPSWPRVHTGRMPVPTQNASLPIKRRLP